MSRMDLDGTERKYHLKDVEPYTGKVFFNYENGNKEFEGFLKDGLQNGHWIWITPEGDVEESEFPALKWVENRIQVWETSVRQRANQ